MIIGYVGTPGSGKSYEAVKKILDNLKTGRVVITNIDGISGDRQREHIKAKTGLDDYQLHNQLHYLDNEQIKSFWDYAVKLPGALIVIDEVHKLFSNREWQTEKNKAFTEWSSTHRHGGYDVLLITQDIEKVDKHERSLIEWTYFFRKINYFGKLVQMKYRRFTYDDDNHFGKAIAEETFSYDKSIFPCYNSYDSAETEELGIQKTVNVLHNPIFYALPVVLGAFIYFFSQSSLVHGDLLGKEKVLDTMKGNKSKGSQNEETISSVDSVPASGPQNIMAASPSNLMILYKLSNNTTHLTNGPLTLEPGVSIISQSAISIRMKEVAVNQTKL